MTHLHICFGANFPLLRPATAGLTWIIKIKSFPIIQRGAWMTAATGHYARKYGVATAAQGPPSFFWKESQWRSNLTEQTWAPPEGFLIKVCSERPPVSPRWNQSSPPRAPCPNRKFSLCHQSAKGYLTALWVASGVCAHFYEHQGHYLPVRGSLPALGSPWALLIWHCRATLTSITWEQPISLLALALPCSHYVSVEKRHANQQQQISNQMCSRVTRTSFWNILTQKSAP